MAKPVKDIDLNKSKDVDKLVRAMHSSGGFTAKKLAVGAEIFEQMIKDKSCTKFLSFPACIIATGTRGVIKEMVKKRLTDAIITTSGTIDHDFARIFKDYYHGEFEMDDLQLRKRKINRLGNILIPYSNYGKIIENKMQPILKKIYKTEKEFSPSEIIFEIGKRIGNNKRAKDSIIYQAAKNKIPIFAPGFESGAFGSQLWMFSQTRPDFRINVLKDEQKLNQIVQNSKKTGALMIGGGISKHHTIWWNQFKGGLDYAVYITTAPEYDGSLSGARVREGISWGKVKEKAKQITIEGEATVLLPLVVASLLERLK